MSKRVHIHYYRLGTTHPRKRFTEKHFISDPYDNPEVLMEFVKNAAGHIDRDLRNGEYGIYRFGHSRVVMTVQGIITGERTLLENKSVVCESDCDESTDCGVEIWVEVLPGPVKQFFINLFRKLKE